jgi:hypothetical protein
MQVTAKVKETPTKSVLIGHLATTSRQNSFIASWHRFYKCLELYRRDATPLFLEKFHLLVVVENSIAG